MVVGIFHFLVSVYVKSHLYRGDQISKNQLKRRKDLFWLLVSEVLVHGSWPRWFGREWVELLNSWVPGSKPRKEGGQCPFIFLKGTSQWLDPQWRNPWKVPLAPSARDQALLTWALEGNYRSSPSLNSIPLSLLIICQLMAIWVVSIFWVWIMVWTFACELFCGHVFISLECILWG